MKFKYADKVKIKIDGFYAGHIVKVKSYTQTSWYVPEDGSRKSSVSYKVEFSDGHTTTIQENYLEKVQE